MSNKQIRKQSRAILYSNLWFFVGVCAIAAIPSLAGAEVRVAVNQPWASIISALITFAAYPLTLGVTRFFLRLWHGNHSPAGEIFYYYKEGRSAPAFVLGAVFAAIDLASFFVTYLVAVEMVFSPGFTLLALVALSVAVLYIHLRLLFLVPYLFVTSVEQSPSRLIAQSLEKTEGYFFKIIALAISIFVAPFIIVYIVSSIFAAMLDMAPASLAFSFEFDMVRMRLLSIMMIPFYPYFNLCFAGFATKLLSQPPRRKIRIPLRNSPSHNKKRYKYKTDWFE